MKRMPRVWMGVCAALLGLQIQTLAQGPPNISGKWTLNGAKSDSGISTGRGPQGALNFESYLTFKQTGNEIAVETDNIRQDSIAMRYTLDGTPVTTKTPAGIKFTGKAAWEGDTLVIHTTRAYSSPMGDVTADIRESFSVSGDVLTVEKTQTQDGKSRSSKAVYDRMAAGSL